MRWRLHRWTITAQHGAVRRSGAGCDGGRLLRRLPSYPSARASSVRPWPGMRRAASAAWSARDCTARAPALGLTGAVSRWALVDAPLAWTRPRDGQEQRAHCHLPLSVLGSCAADWDDATSGGATPRWPSDHQVHNVAALPGAAYCRDDWLRPLGSGGGCRVRDITFEQMLLLDRQTPI